jgi:hypothetical protein
MDPWLGPNMDGVAHLRRSNTAAFRASSDRREGPGQQCTGCLLHVTRAWIPSTDLGARPCPDCIHSDITSTSLCEAKLGIRFVWMGTPQVVLMTGTLVCIDASAHSAGPYVKLRLSRCLSIPAVGNQPGPPCWTTRMTFVSLDSSLCFSGFFTVAMGCRLASVGS